MFSSDDRLLRSRATNILYLAQGNRRRRIVFPDTLSSYRESDVFVPEIELCDENEISNLEFGAVVPRLWHVEDWIEPPQNKQKMREIISSRLTGVGVEYGAGSRPAPVPVNVCIDYAEPWQSNGQNDRMKYSQNIVTAIHENLIEEQGSFESDSLDFVIAAHVIEHTINPIKAIVESYRVLKPGGYLVLIVPDKRRTFDKSRAVTSLDHLVSDYKHPSKDRDLDNYLDFFENAKRDPNPLEAAKSAQAECLDIHFHVWTPASFYEMCTHVIKHYAAFSSLEIKPPVDDPACLEFYSVFKK